MANILPQQYLDLNDMGTQSRGVAVLYGRRNSDGTLIALKCDDNGIVGNSASSFYADQSTKTLNGLFSNAQLSFGFTSTHISVYNDDATAVLKFSFDGTNIHGQLKVGEVIHMDHRAQSSIYLATVGGTAGSYRVIVW